MNADKPVLSSKTTLLPAYASLQMALAGSLFFCTSSTAAFKISIDGDQKLDADQGFRFRLSGGKEFRFLVFHNESSSDNLISYFVGNELVDYFPTVLRVTTVNASTYSKGSGVQTVETLDFTGLDVNGKVRKLIAVTNLDDTNYVDIQDGNSNLLTRVYAADSKAVETGGAITVFNPFHVNFAVWEVFYA